MNIRKQSEVKINSDIESRIVRLRPWIRRRSAMGRWFAQRESDATRATPEGLINALSRSRLGSPLARAAGYYALSEMRLTTSERNYASTMLARELAPRSISDTLMVCVIRAPIIAICVYLILVTIISAMFYVPPPYNPQDIDATTKAEIILPLVLAIISTAPLFVANLRARIVERATLVALSRHGGPQSIVTVFSRMGVHRVTHKPARLALETVIRAVNESWYGRLPQGSERVLIKLAGSGDEELAFDALNAIAKAGGGGAVEFITRLARGAARETVRVRASEVLPILLARKEWEDEPSILLRPTAYPDQHLLLPLQEITPCSNQLLRADSYQSRDIDDIVGPREAARHKY